MTTVMLLLMFGGSAVALSRLLRHALRSDSLAAAWAAVAMLTLPTTAFAFQFYPELPGLLVIMLVRTFVLFAPAESGLLLASAAGTGAAGLAWLHPRFLLVSMVLAIAGRPLERRSEWRSGPQQPSSTSPCSSFNYHVTGSFLPTALWDAARPAEGFAPGRVPLNLIGYALDRTWGSRRTHRFSWPSCRASSCSPGNGGDARFLSPPWDSRSPSRRQGIP